MPVLLTPANHQFRCAVDPVQKSDDSPFLELLRGCAGATSHGQHQDHRKPYGRGGDHRVENIQLTCRTHDGYLAERDHGKEVIERNQN